MSTCFFNREMFFSMQKLILLAGLSMPQHINTDFLMLIMLLITWDLSPGFQTHPLYHATTSPIAIILFQGSWEVLRLCPLSSRPAGDSVCPPESEQLPPREAGRAKEGGSAGAGARHHGGTVPEGANQNCTTAWRRHWFLKWKLENYGRKCIRDFVDKDGK